jgi:hypothetical protein
MDMRDERVESILASVDQRTQSFYEELGSESEAANIMVEATWQ